MLITGFYLIFGSLRTPSESDFSLEITVSRTEFYQGENIQVQATFRNLSGGRQRISKGFHLVHVYIRRESNFYSPVIASPAFSDTIRRRDERSHRENVGHNLPPGEYEVFAVASFSLRRGNIIGSRMEPVNFNIKSDIIILTVK